MAAVARAAALGDLPKAAAAAAVDTNLAVATVAARAAARAVMVDKRVVKVVASNGKHLDEPSSYSLVLLE
jgi:hypothetical protein